MEVIIALGCLAFAWMCVKTAVDAIKKGWINTGKLYPSRTSKTLHPEMFWFFVALNVVFGAFMFLLSGFVLVRHR